MNKLESVILDVFNYENPQTDTEIMFQDLETWDSLAFMNFVVAIEQKFEIELTTEEIVSMQTYSKTKEILENKGAAL